MSEYQWEGIPSPRTRSRQLNLITSSPTSPFLVTVLSLCHYYFFFFFFPCCRDARKSPGPSDDDASVSLPGPPPSQHRAKLSGSNDLLSSFSFFIRLSLSLSLRSKKKKKTGTDPEWWSIRLANWYLAIITSNIIVRRRAKSVVIITDWSMCRQISMEIIFYKEFLQVGGKATEMTLSLSGFYLQLSPTCQRSQSIH